MKYLLSLFLLAFSAQALSVNQGYVCLTYLSKDGSLETMDENKFSMADLDRVVEIYKKLHTEWGEDPDEVYFYKKGLSTFARGLAEDKKSYERYFIKGAHMYFQNGFFMMDRSQDSAFGDMLNLSKKIGGLVNDLCMGEDGEIREISKKLFYPDSN